MGEERIARLRISLEDWEPEVWRTVDVPIAANLKSLHDIVQAAMGWQDYHLWEFEAADVRYGLHDPDWPDVEFVAAEDAKLDDLVGQGVRAFSYTYDMGDDWRHVVTVESVGPAEAGIVYPRLIGGERRCPPEDVGGLPGFDHFLAAVADPAHEDHRELLDWHGGPFDEEDFDAAEASRRVATAGCGPA